MEIKQWNQEFLKKRIQHFLDLETPIVGMEEASKCYSEEEFFNRRLIAEKQVFELLASEAIESYIVPSRQEDSEDKEALINEYAEFRNKFITSVKSSTGSNMDQSASIELALLSKLLENKKCFERFLLEYITLLSKDTNTDTPMASSQVLQQLESSTLDDYGILKEDAIRLSTVVADRYKEKISKMDNNHVVSPRVHPVNGLAQEFHAESYREKYANAKRIIINEWRENIGENFMETLQFEKDAEYHLVTPRGKG